MRFSQRLGISPVEKAIQRESIDDELRNSLWSMIQAFYWETFDKDTHSMYGRCDFVEGSNMSPLITRLWLHFYKKAIDTIPKYFGDCKKELRSYFYQAEWYEVYDFVEFIAQNGPKETKSKFTDVCNSYLERENSAYRFVEDQLTEITSEEEVRSIEDAIAASSPFPGVKEHLTTALSLMSDRRTPDFRNSIKESMSAVESLCKQVAGAENATLGRALNELEKSKNLHPALKSAFSAMYGYTSDADGIRHALMGQNSLSKSDARFMLISCSAFINYVIENVSKEDV